MTRPSTLLNRAMAMIAPVPHYQITDVLSTTAACAVLE